MSSLEQVLLGILLLFAGGFITRLFFPGVSRITCRLNHENLEKYLAACFEPIHERLKRIESKLDAKNGVSK